MSDSGPQSEVSSVNAAARRWQISVGIDPSQECALGVSVLSFVPKISCISSLERHTLKEIFVKSSRAKQVKLSKLRRYCSTHHIFLQL